MILVDTSIWIDHLHSSDARLTDLLGEDEVGSHPWVIAELALGSMKHRAQVLDLLGNLWRFPVLSDGEVRTLVDRRKLWGRGLSVVDVHLLGAVALSAGSALWTRDKRLLAACRELGVSCVDEPGGRGRSRG